MARPKRVTHNHERITEEKSVKTSEIPFSYLSKHLENDALEACCKDVNNLSYYLEKTDPALPDPNKAVIACTCGRKHVRFVGAAGNF